MGRGKKRVWRSEKPEAGERRPKLGEPKLLPVAWLPLRSKGSLIARRCGLRKQPLAVALPSGNKTNKVPTPSTV